MESATNIETIEPNPSKLNEETLDEYLEAAGLPLKGDLPKKATKLATHYAEAGEPLGKCEHCGYSSPASAGNVCPFCGTSDENEEPEERTVKTRSSKLKKSPKTELAKAGEGDSALIPAPELDQAVARIQALQRKGGVVAWQLGKELLEVYKGHLYERRLRPDGTQTYKSWTEWVLKEARMDPGHVSKLMECAATFSEAQVQQYGTSKLSLAVQLPEDQRPAFLSKAETLPFRALRDEVRQAMAGKTRVSAITNSPDKKRLPRPAVSSEPKVTAVLVLGRTKHPLLARPLGKDVAPRPAKNLKDDPWCEVKLANDVTMTMKIVQDTRGELVLFLETTKVKKAPKLSRAEQKARAGGKRGPKKGAKRADKPSKAPKAKATAKKPAKGKRVAAKGKAKKTAKKPAKKAKK